MICNYLKNCLIFSLREESTNYHVSLKVTEKRVDDTVSSAWRMPKLSIAIHMQ